ncbi:MAG: hypothetical protein ACRCVX_12485 [Shewanella sp.]
MSRPDSVASAALDARVIKPVYFAFLDFANDPVRANTSGRTIEITGSGEPDLDGIYSGISHKFVTIGDVKISEGGNESVECVLSAPFQWDQDMLTEITNGANWQGRVARLWRLIRDANNVDQGGYQHYHTGYMTDINVRPSATEQMARLTIEGYISAHSRASGRTYLDQEKYDSGDLSARAAIAIANGVSGNSLTGNTGTPGGGVGGGGGGGRSPFQVNSR